MATRNVCWFTVLALSWSVHAQAQTPDLALSYFVPQSGSVASPTEGTTAVRLFRACPNNDGGSSLPNNARIKIVLTNPNGTPMPNVAAADIYVKLNGGTPAQGFTGSGADSIIANGTYNTSPPCPLVQYLFADAPTNSSGVTYITFAGANPANPGVAVRDPNRKWGHYDSELPVFALGVKLQGRLTSNGTNNEYVLRIKNFDFRGGLGTAMNQGEAVSFVDFNSMIWNIGVSDALSYWRDFDSSGSVGALDFSLINQHMDHDCNTPNL